MAGDLKDKVAFCVGIGARVGEIGGLVVEPEGGRESLGFRGPRKGQELREAGFSAGSPGQSWPAKPSRLLSQPQS